MLVLLLWVQQLSLPLILMTLSTWISILAKLLQVLPIESSISSLEYEAPQLGKHHHAPYLSHVNNRNYTCDFICLGPRHFT